jgi:nucleoid DNA-binding protein
MTYQKLVVTIARKSGLNVERVRAVLQHLPEALLLMKAGDKVQTPLGTFTMFETKQREVALPIQGTMVEVPTKLVVKLRPGKNLRRLP